MSIIINKFFLHASLLFLVIYLASCTPKPPPKADATPTDVPTADALPTRPFTVSMPDEVALYSPEIVTDTFLIGCALDEYESISWLVDPTWLFSQGGIKNVCTAIDVPQLIVERLILTQEQADQTAFVEWVWFEEDETSVVVYFSLERNKEGAWQIVNLTTTR